MDKALCRLEKSCLGSTAQGLPFHEEDTVYSWGIGRREKQHKNKGRCGKPGMNCCPHIGQALTVCRRIPFEAIWHWLWPQIRANLCSFTRHSLNTSYVPVLVTGITGMKYPVEWMIQLPGCWVGDRGGGRREGRVRGSDEEKSILSQGEVSLLEPNEQILHFLTRYHKSVSINR